MGLFTPAWMSKNEQKSLGAVASETDQMKLSEIATRATLVSVRIAAVEKISDQQVLVDLLRNLPLLNTADRIMDTIWRRLTDQTILSDLAMRDSSEYIRSHAVKRLTDQSVIAQVARNDPSWHVRYSAVKSLTDQTALAEIANRENFEDVKIAAMEKLTDQSVLVKIANKHKRKTTVRIKAAMLVSDLSLLSEEALMIRNEELRRIQIEQYKQKEKAERERAINEARKNWRAEGRCPHCGVQLTGWYSETPKERFRDKPANAYTCGACHKPV